MKIELVVPCAVALAKSAGDYDESLDNITSILSDVCDALEDQGKSQLIVSGFGQQRWPVDVRTDLSVLLEQLPDLIESVSSGAPAELDFYEQGIERLLLFTPVAESYDVLCQSRRVGWNPDPSVERINRADLATMLRAVQDGFMSLLRNSSPELAVHLWVVSWLNGKVPKQ